eukprot:g17409.t1
MELPPERRTASVGPPIAHSGLRSRAYAARRIDADVGEGGSVSTTTLQDALSGSAAAPRPASASASASVSASARRARARASAMFLHNARVWALGGPCIAVLLLVGGRATALVAAFGVMACYCFDLADNAEGALVSLWASVLGSAVSLVWSGSVPGLVHKLNIVVFVLLLGVWATLQFRPMYREEPDVARLLERLLFACFPLPAAAILTWAAVAFGGAVALAAPCLALVLYAAVALYAVPLRSGLGGGGAGGVHGDSPRVAPVLLACMLFLPALVQISIDRRLVVWGGAAARWNSLQKVALAAALPWPLLQSLRAKGVLWWANPQLRRRLDKALWAGGLVALLVLCETCKSLVLLPVFRPFLFAAPRPPLDSLLASAALLSLVAAWFVQGAGGRRGTYAARALTVASVRCLGLLLGVEQAVMPLFDLSAFALSMLVFSGRRDLKAYVVGVAGVSSLILWFSWQTVWHLSFTFALPFGARQPIASGQDLPPPSALLSLSLQQVSTCCALLSFGVLVVPGMVAFGARQMGMGVIFGLHAVTLLLLEMVLVGAEAKDPWQLSELYPLPLVGVTGALGTWMAVRLVRDRGVDPLFVWVPGSVSGAKAVAVLLAGLAPTDAESPELSYLATAVPLVSLAMAATAPFALFRRQPPSSSSHSAVETRSGAGGAVGVGAGAGAGGDWSGPMLPVEGGLCVFFMASALWMSSRTVIYPLLEALLGGGGAPSIYGTPSGYGPRVHALGFCGVVLAVYVLAMVSTHFPDSRTARRSGAALLVGSMALLVLKPTAVTEIAFNDGGGGGGDTPWREYVKQVCSIVIAGTGVLTLTGLATPTKTLARRSVFAVTVGAPVGVWSALASMPGADSFTVSCSAVGAAGTYSCALMILLESVVPRPAALSQSSRSSGSGGPAGRGRGGGTRAAGGRRASVLGELYVAVLACMPLAAVAQGLRLLFAGPAGRRLLGIRVAAGAASGADGPSAQGAARFALATAATGHAVIALALKVVGERGAGDVGAGGLAGSGLGRGRGWGGVASSLFRAVGEGRRIPSMGNASAILASLGALLCCWRHLPGESARALAAAPSCALLLLLQEDGRVFDGVTGSGFSTAVPTGALSVAWAGSAAYYILLKGALAPGAPRPWFLFGIPLPTLFGGLIGEALRVYRGTARDRFHGVFGAAKSRGRGEAAVALQAVSFWTADSPWQPLWNLLLLLASVPSHAFLVRFLWGGQGSPPQRAWEVLAALAINVLPLVAGDLTSINLLGLVGLVGGCFQFSEGAAAPPDGVAKKDLMAYIKKAKIKIRKLEEQNKASAVDAAMLGSLREEVEVWKTKFQEQVEATAAAAAATAVPNGESSDPAALDKALQDAAQAQEEASRWKEKAVAAQELEVRVLALEEELQETKTSSEVAQQSVKLSHQEERAQLEALIESLRLERSALETQQQQSGAQHDEAVAEATSRASDLENQVEILLKDAGALEHRLVNTQQERDSAVARSSELEEELARLGACTKESEAAAAEAASKAEELQKQAEALLESSAALEHRLVNTQQERDAAVARSSELEEELARLGAGKEEEAATAAAIEAAESKAASEIAESEARCAASVDAVREEMSEEKKRLEEAATEQRLALEQAVKESEKLRSEVNSLREAAIEHEQALEQAQTESEGLQSEVRGLREAVDGARAGAKEELDAARKGLEQSTERVFAAEREVEEVTRDKEALREELEAERDALSARLSEAEAARSAAEDNAKAMKDEHQQREDKIKMLEDEQQQQEEKMKTMTDELQQQEEKIKMMKEQQDKARQRDDGEPPETAAPLPTTLSGKVDGEGPAAAEAALRARCEELEAEAAVAAKKISALETKLSSASFGALAKLEADKGEEDGDGEGDGDGQSAEITPAVRSTEAEVEEAEKEEEEENMPGKQEVLEIETRLEEAESRAEESKQAAVELEAVVAGLREEQDTLNTRVAELTAEVASAAESSSLLQASIDKEKEGSALIQASLEKQREEAALLQASLEKEKEELEERVEAAEEAALAARREAEEHLKASEEAVAAAEEAKEALRRDKALLEGQVQEATAEAARSEEALAQALSQAAKEEEGEEEASEAASKAREERAALEEQMATQKDKLRKAATRLRSLKEERDAANEKLASTSALLEASEENLADADARCRALEEAAGGEEERFATAAAAQRDAEARGAAAEEKLSVAEQETSELRDQVATLTESLHEAGERAESEAKELNRLESDLSESCRRLGEAEAALRESQERAARVNALEAELETKGARLGQIESELESMRAGARELESLKEGTARESEEIMGALQGQVEAANKERDAAVASLETAEQERETSKTRLKELFVKYKALQAKNKAAQDEADALKLEAEKVPSLEAASGELQSQVEELSSKLVAAEASVKDKEVEFTKTAAEKDQAVAAEKAAKEDLEVKVKRLKTLLSKSQKSSHSKDADLAALKAPPPPPKAFTVVLRVRHDGSTWCLLRTTQASSSGDGDADKADGAVTPEKDDGSQEAGQKQKQQWVTEDKARAWIAGGSSDSDTALWAPVVQDVFEEKAIAAAAETRVVAAGAQSTRQELEALSSEFAKYKARAHTALKKATSSGAEDKRKDELITALQSEQTRLSNLLAETTSSLERQLSDERGVSKAREEDLEAATEQLETAQEQFRELQRSLKDQERKISQLQEAEDGHSEEMSALREARDDLKAQLKAAKAQAYESSSITQRLQEELEELSKAKARENGNHHGSGSWDAHGDGGWAGQQILATNAEQAASGSALGVPPLPLPAGSTGFGGTGSAAASPSNGGGVNGTGVGDLNDTGGRPVQLMAVAELERRHTSVEGHVQAEVSEMRNELAEALLRVEQLSAQESVLKATIRALETDLKTERDLGTGEAAPINVAYLKSAVVRYMSTRDAGEQRSLLRVISTILQMTRQEAADVEARIAELEKTMVGRAGSMVGGAGRRVGGVVGGVVGLVWGGRAAPAESHDPDEFGADGKAPEMNH